LLRGRGGGAIRDLGCHNIDLACWILGEPDEINTMTGFTRGFAVDDTGVCNIKFKNGAVAMVDSSFSEPLSNNWYNFEMYGSKMSFIADTKTVTIIRNGDTGKIVSDKEVINIENLPEGHKLPIAQWIDACTNGGELVCDVDAGLLVNRVLDAADIACREKRTVKI
ncbi:MAG: Gfo/Idh/MocA family oxidoreductase, partial [Eubacteriales bacterium]|nr:Gfo/Idh/MocA family oxidoreductase [Eubacteriales bacterium]